jgi:hypothetical protein
MFMPGKNVVGAGVLLLVLVACSKPLEVSAAGSGTSTSPSKESVPAPAAPAAPVPSVAPTGDGPSPAVANEGAAAIAPRAAAGQATQEAGNAAAAPTPAETGAVVEAQVLIWGGGRTPEEGLEALERFEAERGGLEALLPLGEGYPRVVASDTLPGLKSGFHVVVLGACKPEEVKEPLSTLQAFKPGVYARTVKLALGPGSCPKHENGLGWAGTQSLKAKPFELSAVAFMAIDPAASTVPWLVRLYLRDAKGDLIDQMAVDPRDGMWEGTDRKTCLPLAEVEGAAIRVTVKCDTLAGGPWAKERNQELAYRINAGKIEWVSSPH